MKKRTVAFILVIIMIGSLLPMTALAAGSLSNFYPTKTYTDQFTDVPASWYADYVELTYEYGLFNGKTDTTFEPDSFLTLAEAIKLAAVMNSIYKTGVSTLENGKNGAPWYQPYVDYALENGIIASGFVNYNADATRADFAIIFAQALPSEALTPKNTVDDDAIPDVAVSYTYAPAVYLLYRAGVLTGSGEDKAFKPNDNIKRSEVSAIVARMVSANKRVSYTLTVSSTQELTETEIAALCTPAVFYIELYDASGTPFSSGSGFFISSSGLAVTNYHVIENASSAKITMKNGNSYDVVGVYDYSESNDLALLQIDGDNFPYLEIGDLSNVVTGAHIFAIGYPGGIAQTFTPGSITNATYLLDGVNFMLINAAISNGSSGGALLNTFGKVVGVTTGSYTSAQNLNLAVPINLIDELDRTAYAPISPILPQNSGDIHVSNSNVSVTVGERIKVTLTDISGNPNYNVMRIVSDYSIATGFLGFWTDNYNCPFYIEGLSAGQATITLYLLDENDDVVAYTTINVTVGGSGTRQIAYYPEYLSIPDFGAYTGTPQYRKRISNNVGGYLYRMEDVPVNNDIANYGYINLLIDSGFTYEGYEYNSSGFKIFIFSNDLYFINFDVFYMDTGLGTFLCYELVIIPLS